MTEENQVFDFFNFQFVVGGGELKQTTLDGEIIDETIGNSLFIIKQKYDKMKKRKKIFDKKQQKYCEDLEARCKEKKHYQEHIKKAETKLCEYKNTILAFGKLATCNSISK